MTRIIGKVINSINKDIEEIEFRHNENYNQEESSPYEMVITFKDGESRVFGYFQV